MNQLITWHYPVIARAIAETARPGYTPLVLRGNGWGALRWLDAGASDGEGPPPSLLEPPGEPPEPEEPVEDEDEEEDDGENDDEGKEGPAPTAAPVPAPAKPPRKPSAVEMIELFLQMGTEVEVFHLTTLTPAEVDGEIAFAGFDPEVERALGPGIRQRVLVALMRKKGASGGEP
jgi:hypothetical protein